MYGCEWDDQTDEVGGYRQHGFDGEDFLVWNVKTNTWIAAKQQGFMTATRWNNDKADLEYRKNYLSQECVEWLKKYVNFGRSSLMKTGKLSWFTVAVTLQWITHCTLYLSLFFSYFPFCLTFCLFQVPSVYFVCPKIHNLQVFVIYFLCNHISLLLSLFSSVITTLPPSIFFNYCTL